MATKVASYARDWVTERDSEEFVEYYKTQGVVAPEEWDEFYSSLKEDLPICFRIVGSTLHTENVKAHVEKVCETLRERGMQGVQWSVPDHAGWHRKWAKDETAPNVGVEGNHPSTLPSTLSSPPYPDGLAYKVSIARSVLRSDVQLKSFHRYLVNQSEAGTLFRQEEVSMIPATLMNVQPGHRVLDLCAAPGSKTSQLAEQMQSGADQTTHPSTGVVVANDVNSGRGHLLIHHLRRLCSPNLVVTNHQAQLFPNIFCEKTNERLLFDSVLCDVPCSSDGTLRKSPCLWGKWTSNHGVGCHRLQIQIARRGASVCKVGGTLVYSTCSLNPIENEAVVGALLEEGCGSLELVDCTDRLHLLKRRKGISTWKVCYSRKWYVSDSEVPDRLRRKIKKTMFPTENPDVAEHLSRCMRFVPHDNNTGGFFVAVLKKTGVVPWEYLGRAANFSSKEAAEIGAHPNYREIIKNRSSSPTSGGLHDPDAEDEDEEDEEDEDDGADEDDRSLPPTQPEPSTGTASKTYAIRPWTRQKDFLALSERGAQEEVKEFWMSFSEALGCAEVDISRLFAVRTDGESGDTNAAVSSMRYPKKIWYASEDAAALMHYIGKSPYKVLHVGCPAFDRNSAGCYRYTLGGAKWLTNNLLPEITKGTNRTLAGADQCAVVPLDVVRRLIAGDLKNDRLLASDVSDVAGEAISPLKEESSFLLISETSNGDIIKGWKSISFLAAASPFLRRFRSVFLIVCSCLRGKAKRLYKSSSTEAPALQLGRWSELK